MRYSLLTIIFLCCFGTNSVAQFCYLYYVSGEVSIQSKNTSAPAKRGDSFAKGQFLLLKAGSEVGVLNDKGLVVPMKQAGKYSYDQVMAIVAKTERTATTYLAFVWKEFNTKKTKNASEMPLKRVAGVSRSEEIPMRLPLDSAIVISKEIHFFWRPLEGRAYFTLQDVNGSDVLRLGTGDSSLVIYPVYSRLQPGKIYRWTITEGPYATTNGYFSFSIPDKEWLEKYEKELEDFRKIIDGIDDRELRKQLTEEFHHFRNISH